MAETNFRIFNEENAADKTYNDSEYEQATQRLGGVTPGMALSRLHNKLYLQTSVMAKAIADFLVKQGYDCYDNQATDITANLENAIKSFNASVVAESITAHNADTDAHEDFGGATASAAGVRGMVPAPTAGSENKVLTGGKIWSLIEELNVSLGDIAAPEADTAALKTLLGGMAYMFKSITGESDWKNNPKINLATLFTLVGNLSSGSDVVWDDQKFTNAKLGVSGLMAQNGYIQFGPNFGGLIVQWGFGTTYPISFTQFCVVSCDDGMYQHVVYYTNPAWVRLDSIGLSSIIGFISIGR
jgi:hypothetical protein|uniref:Tail fiber protein n=1 Tax=Myoviridae sp. ctiu99 TaxID=2825158 RepID=A0A8S5NV31_9CAUD|nr:MAG TPA: hypothetical protein [Myoviridae sp. ctiu99]